MLDEADLVELRPTVGLADEVNVDGVDEVVEARRI